MSAMATSGVSRTAAGGTRRLMVRMNGTLFHCLGAALLLEAAVVARHDRTSVERGACGESLQEDGRRSEKRARVTWLREYVSGVWPEFDWAGACSAMETAPPTYAAGQSASHPVSALGPKLDAEHAAVFYEGLSRWADDPALRGQLQAMSVAESTYARTPNAVEGTLPRPLRILRRLQAVRVHAQDRRDRVVRGAYEVLQQHWTDTPAFPALSYEEFLARAHALTAPHLRLDWVQRMLLRVWTERSQPRRLAGNRRFKAASRATRAHTNETASLLPACALPPSATLR